jgi:hypothetical protein
MMNPSELSSDMIALGHAFVFRFQKITMLGLKLPTMPCLTSNGFSRKLLQVGIETIEAKTSVTKLFFELLFSFFIPD